MSESKPTGYVLAVVDDLFFAEKIAATGRALGVTVRTAKTFAEAEVVAASAGVPALLTVDLNLGSADPLDIVRRVRAHATLSAAPMASYLSHVQVDLAKSARDAGAGDVMPRSKFSQGLPHLLAKHCGVELPA
jgi:CheY-like chemotaxis protein